jgi:hypothetical protein
MRSSEPGSGSRRRPVVWLLAIIVAGAVLAGAAGFLLLGWPPASRPVVATAPIAPAATPAFQIETATEAEIRGHVPSALTVFRFADNPRILILDFASLHEQGEMLNRVAAFVEKTGLPRDRVLTDAELDAAIHAQGDTVETFYFGHDYSAAALVRFFASSDSAHIELNAQEERLRALLKQEGWFATGVSAGLISLPAAGSDPRITPAARAAILRHELSHGEFFSNPEYADYVHRFWLGRLSDAERNGVRSFLAKENYDRHEEELMFNEMQAYLMFTRDPTFFRPDEAGLTPQRLAAIQAEFLAEMPAGWLRNVLAGYHGAIAAQ